MARAKRKAAFKKGIRRLKRKATADATQQSDEAGSDEESKKPASKHTWEGTFLLKRHKPGCVNRHVAWYAVGNTCSHRGQAKKHAQEDFSAYLKSGDSSAPARQDEWDPRTPGNYERSASTPFAHEAHHIVAAAELRNAIIKASQGIEPEGQVLLMLRSGLLKEKYNINDKLNMIILPMDQEAVRTLGLPRHRKTPEHRFHTAYSLYIQQSIRSKLGWLSKAAEKHEVPPYKPTRKQIEEFSQETYSKIKEAGRKIKSGEASEDESDLDSMAPYIFGKAKPDKTGMKSRSGRPGSRT